MYSFSRILTYIRGKEDNKKPGSGKIMTKKPGKIQKIYNLQFTICNI
jgi:hypothetical protein